jgi:phosphoribosylformimino-5-aminoimidazole carboxamide ribotide isomerase
MEIIPAIDLRGGKCVRLYQGDYSQETVFSEDPAAMARRWAGEGARRLHLVDLDGAAQGRPGNLAAVEAILGAVQIPVQFGGGVRSLKTVERLLEMGIGRVILGTAAVEGPFLVKEACRRFGEGIVVSIDTREGLVATRGWQERIALKAIDLVKIMAALGVRMFIYTDIARDGTLTEPNLEAIAEMASAGFPLIAAGGISSIAHLKRLKQIGVEGAIVGRALYAGHLDLREALEAVAKEG